MQQNGPHFAPWLGVGGDSALSFGIVSGLSRNAMLANFNGSSAETQWQRFCELLWYEADLGIWLDISRMAIGQADLDSLSPRFNQAFAAMEALEAGAIANADEQRQVGHYWLRKPELAPEAAISQHIEAELERIKPSARLFLRDPF